MIPDLPAEASAALAELVALVRTWDCGRRAISIGGSTGKGTRDGWSDLDLRVFCEREIPEPPAEPARWAEVAGLERKWLARGVRIDGVWARTIGEITAELRLWAAGEALPREKVWCVYGYHLPTDVWNQRVIDDPSGVIAELRAILTPYPAAMKASILRRHGERLAYWRNDYHYASKVRRGDAVFLAGLTARLVQDIMQVVYAVNEAFIPGDGANLTLAATLPRVPADFSRRVIAALSPGAMDAASFGRQREQLLALIDDVMALARA